jgi:C1A family cysteine protease
MAEKRKAISGRMRLKFRTNETAWMKISARILALAVVGLMVGGPSRAQSVSGGNGGGNGQTGQGNASPIQYVSNQQYNQMVQSGQLKEITAATLLDQVFRTVLRDLKNTAIVNEYVRENPNLPGFLQMLRVTPNSPNVHQTLEGNYRSLLTLSNGLSETIETNGPGIKLAEVSNSIVTAADPVKQLAIYAQNYNEYTAMYNQICNAQTAVPGSPDGNLNGATGITGDQNPNQAVCQTLPSPTTLVTPTSLQGSPLPVLRTAIAVIVLQGQTLLHANSGAVSNGPVPCPLEVGASTAPNINLFGYGDQTQGPPGTFAANGIYANFNYPNKDLISCVKNQGQRGTCHIFASTSAVEEIIARDRGIIVNLSEQDFMENLKAIWDGEYFNDGGYAEEDLGTGSKLGYHFAYESAWDYNPSLSQPGPPAYEYVNSCNNYPYPASELGCSDTAPQAPQVCTLKSGFQGVYTFCGLNPVVEATTSSYSPEPAVSIWDPADKGTSVGKIYLALAFNNAVIVEFNATNGFQATSSPGYIGNTAADDTTSVGGHAVHIVGYVDNADLAANPNTATAPPGAGGGYFIIKNSWGTGWGDNGYGYMSIDYLTANTSNVLVVSSVID